MSRASEGGERWLRPLLPPWLRPIPLDTPPNPSGEMAELSTQHTNWNIEGKLVFDMMETKEHLLKGGWTLLHITASLGSTLIETSYRILALRAERERRPTLFSALLQEAT